MKQLNKLKVHRSSRAASWLNGLPQVIPRSLQDGFHIPVWGKLGKLHTCNFCFLFSLNGLSCFENTSTVVTMVLRQAHHKPCIFRSDYCLLDICHVIFAFCILSLLLCLSYIATLERDNPTVHPSGGCLLDHSSSLSDLSKVADLSFYRSVLLLYGTYD